VISRTLFRYVTAEMLRALTVALSWLMLIGLLVIFLRTRFTDAGRLLGYRECLAGLVVLVPYLLGFLLPAALLATAISTFGRLSADNELVAMRASGLSPASAAAAPLALGLVCSLLLLWLNIEGFRYAADQLAEMESGLQFSVERLTKPGTSFEVSQGKDTMVFTFLEPRDGAAPVRFTRMDRDGQSFQFVARRHECRIYSAGDRAGRLRRTVDISLFDVQAVQDPFEPYGGAYFRELHFTGLEMPGAISRALIGGGSAMRSSLPQNLQAIRDLETRQLERTGRLEKLRAAARAHLAAGGGWSGNAAQGCLALLSYTQCLANVEQAGEDAAATRAEVSRKIAFSLSPIFFALIGVGLGALARRSSKLIGLSLGVLVASLYYGTWVIGKALAQQGLFPHTLAPWLPNVLCLAAGLWLLARLNRALT
jgi:lipopolysaccharide export LptBFGC system permease protein LptF